jgi:hypothetical protein
MISATRDSTPVRKPEFVTFAQLKIAIATVPLHTSILARSFFPSLVFLGLFLLISSSIRLRASLSGTHRFRNSAKFSNPNDAATMKGDFPSLFNISVAASNSTPLSPRSFVQVRRYEGACFRTRRSPLLSPSSLSTSSEASFCGGHMHRCLTVPSPTGRL